MTESTQGENVNTTIKFNEFTPLDEDFKTAVSDALMDVLMEFDMTGNTFTIDVHPNGEEN